ncbi:hypothetical protein [Asaia krungthepensis]|uniref:DUF1134 domain-containing protein n=1 Tax=Asaia krungthepensis NRIC 0535 TaxID=1307925 RepID=A0ABQ0Q027_9PROT|nr:hypothetical protein [Asaia krungthepensis]GBQ85802.1 hypothetical protein AA0535_0860 [Asaia krungthepensis NRIC 0535]
MFPRSFAAFAASVPLCLLAVSAHAVPGATTSITPQENATPDKSAPVEDSAINFTLQEVGGGLGYEWGKGTLHHNGKDYAFEIGGGGIASIGYIAVKGTGTVKDLTRLDQFDGTYWTVKADAAIGSGVGAAVLENQYGVKLDLKMSIKGAHVGASVMRLRFRLLPDKTEKLAAQ